MVPLPVQVPPALRGRLERIEQELRRWDHLKRLLPVPGPGWRRKRPRQLLDELRALAGLHAGWDEIPGRLLRMAQELGVHAAAGHRSFATYCQEHLGMGEKTARQRIGLDRRLDRSPLLRQALRSGRLGYEQVRLLSFVAPGEVPAWIEKAAPMTVVELERALDQDRKISAKGVEMTLPVGVNELLREAMNSAREREGRWLTGGECLAIT